MIILQDSQIKKIFHNGDEVKKILDWDGNVIFYKQSGGGGMTNYIKFHTTSAVDDTYKVIVTYTDSTQYILRFSEPNKEYTFPIPTDKTVKTIGLTNNLVDELTISCKIYLSKSLFTEIPSKLSLIYCDATSSTSLSNLFSGSTSTEIVMRNLDVRNVTDMRRMFYDCTSKIIDIENLNTFNVTDMNGMFRDCDSLTSLNLSGFDTTKVTDMSYMFIDCSGLTSLDLSGWDMTNVTKMSGMFNYCSKLNTIKMIGCNQTTIDKIKEELTSAGILNNVTIITE